MQFPVWESGLLLGGRQAGQLELIQLGDQGVARTVFAAAQAFEQVIHPVFCAHFTPAGNVKGIVFALEEIGVVAQLRRRLQSHQAQIGVPADDHYRSGCRNFQAGKQVNRLSGHFLQVVPEDVCGALLGR